MMKGIPLHFIEGLIITVEEIIGKQMLKGKEAFLWM